MLTTLIIGNKIAEARKKINISQAQLAERLFISSQAVGKWERGESLPDIITLNRLSEILGVDLNYFSDSFQSIVTEKPITESLDKQPDGLTTLQTSSNVAQLTSGKQNLTAGNAGKKMNWDMSCGNWVDADFSGLKNLHDKFSSSNMQRSLFIGSDLSGLLLKTNNVEGCDFSGSDISNSHIQYSNLVKNVFKDCSLKETEFSGSNIDSCDFFGASFSGSEFSKSHLFGCDFNRADFTGAKFKSSCFQKSTVTNAVLKNTAFIATEINDTLFNGTIDNCYFENCSFKKVSFQNATLINTFFKNNENLKRIKFIDCKADRMTYEFLKQGKADLTGVTLLVP
jgi:uncharacterized protein YjbI with pentapeptide repeats/transcriptional regulator with XRE-family HTH domain